MVEQKAQAQEKGIVGAVAQPPAPRQFGKDRVAEPEPIRQMKKIVVMRHGESYWDSETRQHHLSRDGVRQMGQAAEGLKALVAGKRAVIMTSIGLEVKSAELLGEKLGIGEIKKDNRLSHFHDNSVSGSRDWFSECMKDLPHVDADVVIIVMCPSEASRLLYRIDFAAELRKAELRGESNLELVSMRLELQRCPEYRNVEAGEFFVADL